MVIHRVSIGKQGNVCGRVDRANILRSMRHTCYDGFLKIFAQSSTFNDINGNCSMCKA